MASRRPKTTAAPTPPTAPGRVIDYDALRLVSRASTLLDVTVERFAGTASQPLAGIAATSLKQEMAFRGERRPMDGELVAARMECRFTVSTPEGRQLCEVEASLWSIYSLNAPIASFQAEAVDEFAEVNGLYHAWPFVRELVASCCTRLGLAGVLLPIWSPPNEFPARGEYHRIGFEPEPTVA